MFHLQNMEYILSDLSKPGFNLNKSLTSLRCRFSQSLYKYKAEKLDETERNNSRSFHPPTVISRLIFRENYNTFLPIHSGDHIHHIGYFNEL